MKIHELGLQFPDYAPRRSGLLVPVDLGADPAPLDLPPDLVVGKPGAVFIQRDVAEPFSSVHAWVDAPALGFASGTKADLIEGIRHLPFQKSFQAIAHLIRVLAPIAQNPRAQLALAETIYAALPEVMHRLRGHLVSHPGRLVFAEPILIALLRLLIDEASDVPDQLSDGDLELMIETLMFAAPSALAPPAIAEGEADSLDWLAFFMTKSNFLRQSATLNGLVRQHMLFDRMRGDLDPRSEQERCDIDGAMERAYGLTIDEQMRLGIALASQLHLWADLGEESHVMRLPPGGFRAMLRSIGLEHREEEAVSIVSRSRSEFKQEFGRLDPGASLLVSMTVPFQQTPFLRNGDGSMLLTSPRFMSDWLEDGFHYRVLDAVAGEPRSSARSGRYLRFSGYIFESYCVDLATEVHRSVFAGHVKVIGDFTYDSPKGERRSVDMMIVSDDGLILAEIEHHRPGIPVVVKGERDAAEQSVTEHLIKLTHGLSDFVELLRSEDAPVIPGLDRSRIRRIWPVIVSVETPPLLPPLWNLLDETALPRLRLTGAEPLTILDAEDFETLCGIVESGKSVASILERKCAGPYSRLDFRTWMNGDPLAPAPRRPKVLNDKYESTMDSLIARLRSAE